MLKRLTITDLGLSGLNVDVPPWTLPSSFVTYGDNFRVELNAIAPVRSFSGWGDDKANIPNIGSITFVPEATEPYWLMCAREGVYTFDGSDYHDVTPAVLIASPLHEGQEHDWSTCKLGGVVIIYNPSIGAFYQTGASINSGFDPLPWDAYNKWQDQSVTASVIRSHKTFLFALNLVERGANYGDAYRWSTSADTNGIPFTWDPNEPSGLAGRAQLGGDGGHIVDGLTLRDSFIIYSRNSIDVLDFTGDAFVWRRRELSSSVGLIATDCVVAVHGKHYFISDGDIKVTDGTNLDSIMHGRIKNMFATRINSEFAHLSYAVSDIVQKEVWFCVPVDSSKFPNKAFIFNWQEESWSVRNMPDECYHTAYGVKHDNALDWNKIKNEGWDAENVAWRTYSSTALGSTMVAATTKLLALASATDIVPPKTGFREPTHVERISMPIVDHEQICTVSAAYPHMSGHGDVSFRFGSQMTAGGAVQWNPPVVFTVGEEHKIDVKVTGRYLCWQIEGFEDDDWRLSGIDIVFEHAGVR